MGSSHTLEQQAKENTEFQEYVEKQTAHLAVTATTAQTAMNAEMDAFYKKGGWTDAKPLTSGSYQHQATASEWSLDHVTKMIDAVRGAVFGGLLRLRLSPTPTRRLLLRARAPSPTSRVQRRRRYR